jgi:hypothetical protein
VLPDHGGGGGEIEKLAQRLRSEAPYDPRKS